jgi:hypothetical protein
MFRTWTNELKSRYRKKPKAKKVIFCFCFSEPMKKHVRKEVFLRQSVIFNSKIFFGFGIQRLF